MINPLCGKQASHWVYHKMGRSIPQSTKYGHNHHNGIMQYHDVMSRLFAVLFLVQIGSYIIDEMRNHYTLPVKVIQCNPCLSLTKWMDSYNQTKFFSTFHMKTYCATLWPLEVPLTWHQTIYITECTSKVFISLWVIIAKLLLPHWEIMSQLTFFPPLVRAVMT